MPDHYNELRFDWTRLGGTTMGPSPLVDAYSMTWKYEPYQIENGEMRINSRLLYRAEIKWSKHAGTLAKLVDPQQLTHRSRAIAVAVDALRVNELDHRLAQVRENITEYRKYALSERESHEVSEIVREETKLHLHLNYQWINSYIRDHIRSSLGGSGHKWREALSMPRSEWSAVLAIIKANVDEMDSHPTWYPSNKPLSGERARSNELKAIGNWYPGQTEWSEVTRTRIITFGNYMSLWTVFIPDKASWYQRVLKSVRRY